MTTKQDAEHGENSFQEEVRVPLLQHHGDSADEEDQRFNSSKGHQWMVYLSTFVAVCGSYAFGACVSSKQFDQTSFNIALKLKGIGKRHWKVSPFFLGSNSDGSQCIGFQAGYSSPTQSAIEEDLSLSLAQVRK